MSDEFVSKEVHEEFARRVQDENDRQNHRIGKLEETMTQFTNIALSVQRLASNMEAMLKEQKLQGDRLQKLENRDGDMWRTVTTHAITAIVGIVVAYVFMKLGMK